MAHPSEKPFLRARAARTSLAKADGQDDCAAFQAARQDRSRSRYCGLKGLSPQNTRKIWWNRSSRQCHSASGGNEPKTPFRCRTARRKDFRGKTAPIRTQTRPALEQLEKVGRERGLRTGSWHRFVLLSPCAGFEPLMLVRFATQ